MSLLPLTVYCQPPQIVNSWKKRSLPLDEQERSFFPKLDFLQK
ncbi:MAG: hypothetical protein SXA11_12340 [Cyanobacteriota bacterium]|nr:hypothetical protein [Cyanobacteriota bacterium]